VETRGTRQVVGPRDCSRREHIEAELKLVRVAGVFADAARTGDVEPMRRGLRCRASESRILAAAAM
jgi:hypothetical protein